MLQGGSVLDWIGDAQESAFIIGCCRLSSGLSLRNNVIRILDAEKKKKSKNDLGTLVSKIELFSEKDILQLYSKQWQRKSWDKYEQKLWKR